MKEEDKEFFQASCLSVILVTGTLAAFGVAIAIIVGIPTAAIIWIIQAFQN